MIENLFSELKEECMRLKNGNGFNGDLSDLLGRKQVMLQRRILAADYPCNCQALPAWQEQEALIDTLYPGIDHTGLREQAEFFLGQPQIWDATIEKLTTEGNVQVPVFDGLLVFPWPGKMVQKMYGADLWQEKLYVRDSPNYGVTHWQTLLKDVLCPKLLGKYKYMASRVADGRPAFVPFQEVIDWFRQNEGEWVGDLACRPVSFGRAWAGEPSEVISYLRSKLGVIDASVWAIGHGLLTSEIIQLGSLGVVCLGDHCLRYDDDPIIEVLRFSMGQQYLNESERLKQGQKLTVLDLWYRWVLDEDKEGIAFML